MAMTHFERFIVPFFIFSTILVLNHTAANDSDFETAKVYRTLCVACYQVSYHSELL